MSRTESPVSRPIRHISRLLWFGLLWNIAALTFRCAADPIPDYSVTLEWDANNEPDVAGYRLYYGPASGIYTEAFDAGNTTVATVLLVPGTTYYFAVTAYNSEGLESAFSGEIIFTAPVVPDLLIQDIEPPGGLFSGNRFPAITRPSLLPNGSLSFIISARAGEPLQVEVSSDLVTWTCRGTLENPTGGISIIDPDASRHPRRFYRVVAAAGE